jgi:hypothetical protein
MFNFIDIYSFSPASGCVGMDPSALLSPGAYYGVKTVLTMINQLFDLNILNGLMRNQMLDGKYF